MVGKTVDQIKEIKELRPVINQQGDQIIGAVIYVDNYGNVITNITRKLFMEVENQELLPFLQEMSNSELYTKPTATPLIFPFPKKKREEDGKKIALFNDADHLELAIYKSNTHTVGSAQSLFGLEYRESITVKFE